MAGEAQEGPKTKIERLRVAGAVAPVLRDGAPMRRVAIVDAEGNVVGYRDLRQVQKQLLERAKIELDVAEGVRPDKVICQACGRVIKVLGMGPVPEYCRAGCLAECIYCGKPIRVKNAVTVSRGVFLRGDSSCRACSMAKLGERTLIKHGRVRGVAAAARDIGISAKTIWKRIGRGMTLEQAIAMGPARPRRSKRGSTVATVESEVAG